MPRLEVCNENKSRKIANSGHSEPGPRRETKLARRLLIDRQIDQGRPNNFKLLVFALIPLNSPASKYL